MSQFVSDNDEQIKSSITEVTKKLNECITKWYPKIFPEDDLADFKGCCNEDEINLLVTCYNIFSKNKNLQSPDYDFINALLMYYYNVVVLEYYVHPSIHIYPSINKYLKIVNEKFNKLQGRIVFTDNYDDKYRHCKSGRTKSNNIESESNDIECVIKLQDPELGEFYIRSNKNNLRETDPYVYRDKELTQKVIPEDYMDCFENMLTTEQSKEYYNLLIMGEEDWISQIRRKMMNMNPEPFEGYKGGKKIRKNTKKTKRNLKKHVKKSRKNKGG